MTKKIRIIGFGVLAAVWIGLILGAWFGPTRELSESERRKLAQMPAFSAEDILSGKFMTHFEDFSQFQLARFSSLKAGSRPANVRPFVLTSAGAGAESEATTTFP